MPYQDKLLSYLVLIASAFVIVGAGHGVGPIFIFQVSYLSNFEEFKQSICLSRNCTYDQSLAVTALLFTLGQVTLLLANLGGWSKPRNVGLILLWIGLLYLCHNFDNLSGFTFTLSFPFVVLSGLLVTKLVVDRYRKIVQN